MLIQFRNIASRTDLLTAPLPSSAPEPPCASSSWMGILQRFARHVGLSRGVAHQFSLCRRSLSRRLYQHRWECYRSWCPSRDHSVSNPPVSKIADILFFLRKEKHLSVSALKGYRSTLPSVFKYKIPELQDRFVLRDLIRSFEVERSLKPVGPPSWDLVKVLEYLWGPVFEPLSSKPLQIVTIKALFLLFGHCQEGKGTSGTFFSSGL